MASVVDRLDSRSALIAQSMGGISVIKAATSAEHMIVSALGALSCAAMDIDTALAADAAALARLRGGVALQRAISSGVKRSVVPGIRSRRG